MSVARRMQRLGMSSLLLGCAFTVGCGFRALTEREVVGSYEANAQWGKSTLVLHPDHSFEQTVVRNDHTQASTKGTWQLDLLAGKNASYGIIILKPFLEVSHDHKGDPVDGGLPSISRGFLWGITIAADPDWGISFDKE
jgi:hypothetical protein